MSFADWTRKDLLMKFITEIFLLHGEERGEVIFAQECSPPRPTEKKLISKHVFLFQRVAGEDNNRADVPSC